LKNYKKQLSKTARVILFLFMIYLPSAISAFAGELKINPTLGRVVKGEEFIIDILIDSEGSSLVEATAVIVFDPTLIQITEVKRNASLFDTFPENEQTTDNDNGVIMITGFTQSGNGTLYNTSGDPDVLVRVTFEANREGTVDFEWEYSGSNEPFKSVLMKDGSPPTNVLSSKPSSVTFTILEDDSGNTTPTTGLMDNTSLSFAIGIFVAGVALTIGIVILNKNQGYKLISSNGKTIVVIDE
jgi:hypothetical protein